VKMTKREANRIIAERIMGIDSEKFEGLGTHEWYLNDDGEIDTSAYYEENHNGPMCMRCGYSYCHHCQDGPDERIMCKSEPNSYTDHILYFNSVTKKLIEKFRIEVTIIEAGTVECRLISKEEVFKAKAETLSLALCIAALNSIGFEIDEIVD
jgi:hypothetical protein